MDPGSACHIGGDFACLGLPALSRGDCHDLADVRRGEPAAGFNCSRRGHHPDHKLGKKALCLGHTCAVPLCRRHDDHCRSAEHRHLCLQGAYGELCPHSFRADPGSDHNRRFCPQMGGAAERQGAASGAGRRAGRVRGGYVEMSGKYGPIMEKLYSWGSNGIKKVEGGLNDGTVLICRAPHIGTEAWFHELYQPALSEDEIGLIADSLKVSLPDDYVEFFREYNGINLFSDALSIWGLRKSYTRTGDEVYQPYDVISHNPGRARESGSLVLIGSYSCDGSYIAYNPAEDGIQVFRCDEKRFKILNRWNNLTHLLESEINRLSALFDEKGVKLDSEAPTIPAPSETGGSGNVFGLLDGMKNVFKQRKTQKRPRKSNKADYSGLRSKAGFDEVSFGSRTVRLFKDEEIPEAQTGYGVDEEGRPLTGAVEGDWKESWLVIADEDLCGDPIFIDTDEKGCPVYTAAHGEGSWEPERIAVSSGSFVKALKYISEVSKDRENPVKLENNPLSEEERKSVVDRISSDNEGLCADFWLAWLCNFD